MLRIGQGFDLHRLVVDRPLILGGVNIPFELGSSAHSDGDCLIHAIIDALIGALALGDIGKFFPDNDNKYRGIDSRILLRDVYKQIRDKHNYHLVNLDTTIIIEKPKLRDYIDTMRTNLALDLMSDVAQINVKAKTSEGIGIVGDGLAVIAEAVVLLENGGK